MDKIELSQVFKMYTTGILYLSHPSAKCSFINMISFNLNDLIDSTAKPYTRCLHSHALLKFAAEIESYSSRNFYLDKDLVLSVHDYWPVICTVSVGKLISFHPVVINGQRHLSFDSGGYCFESEVLFSVIHFSHVVINE